MLHIIHNYKEIAIDKVVCEPGVMQSMYKLQNQNVASLSLSKHCHKLHSIKTFRYQQIKKIKFNCSA